MKSPLTGGNDYTGSTENFEDKIDVLSGNVGVRPFKYFGVEGFYQQSLSDNQIKYQEHYSGSDKFAQAEYNIRYGAGAQFWMTRRLNFRLMYRHIPLDGDFMEDIDELSFGVRYNF